MRCITTVSTTARSTPNIGPLREPAAACRATALQTPTTATFAAAAKVYPVIRVILVSGDSGTLSRMSWADKTIPIQSNTPHAGCHACVQSDAGPACQAVNPEPAMPPRLSGPTEELQRLMAALAPRLGFAETPGAGAGLVRALAVMPGEVTLELAVGRACGGQGLIDAAFQTLRRLLPDTDIYVTHAQ